MILTPEEVNKIAHLASLGIDEDDIPLYEKNLNKILDFVAQLNEVDTETVEPLAHPLELAQRLRPDAVSEPNQKELMLALSHSTEAGLYLVPIVIE